MRSLSALLLKMSAGEGRSVAPSSWRPTKMCSVRRINDTRGPLRRASLAPSSYGFVQADVRRPNRTATGRCSWIPWREHDNETADGIAPDRDPWLRQGWSIFAKCFERRQRTSQKSYWESISIRRSYETNCTFLKLLNWKLCFELTGRDRPKPVHCVLSGRKFAANSVNVICR